MQRTAGMIVTVKADGVPEAIFNGQRDRVVESVKAEMARVCAQKDREIAEERDRADKQYEERCSLLGEKLSGIVGSLTSRRGPVKRALRAIEGAWALVWATVSCWVEIGETLGLWERVYDEDI